ncbi:TPA: ead/Ea22-like family protein [Citrobacter freundii]|nr:ead/Ea22-like family protein [Citrobacter freundii]
MRLTNIQLIHAAHHAARYLPKASAELVRELATRLDVALVAQRETAKLRDVLAAENAGLNKFIDDECYVYGPHDVEPVDAALEKPKTPATDAFLAEVRAQGGKVALPTGYSVRPGHPINEAERGVMIPKDNGQWLSRHDVEHALRVAGISIQGE